MRIRRWTAPVVTAAAVAAVTAPAAHAEGGLPTREHAAAARAVAELTASGRAVDGVAVTLPDDFRELIGYHPAVQDGLLVNPYGGCSSPVPLPSEFDVACRAHDLGYDLLRYAHLTGGDLGPWARSALDDDLDRRMHDACDAREHDRVSCFAMANVATTAVTINSVRQGHGVPVIESWTWMRYLGAAASAASALMAATIVARRVRRGARA